MRLMIVPEATVTTATPALPRLPGVFRAKSTSTRVPSRCQDSGSSLSAVSVTCRTPVPSEFIIQTSLWLEAQNASANAIRVPAGDHLGTPAFSGSAVSFCSSLPSTAFIVLRERACCGDREISPQTRLVSATRMWLDELDRSDLAVSTRQPYRAAARRYLNRRPRSTPGRSQ